MSTASVPATQVQTNIIHQAKELKERMAARQELCLADKPFSYKVLPDGTIERC